MNPCIYDMYSPCENCGKCKTLDEEDMDKDFSYDYEHEEKLIEKYEEE